MNKFFSKAKSFVKKHRKAVSIGMAILCMSAMFAVPASAETVTPDPVTFEDLSPVLTTLQSQISVGTIVAILAGVVTAAIGLAFMWWAVRKLIRVLMSAFKKGKVSV